MPLYYGKSEDGSDMKEFEGFHTSSCGNYYGNFPFTKEKERALRKEKNKQFWKDFSNGKLKKSDDNN